MNDRTGFDIRGAVEGVGEVVGQRPGEEGENEEEEEETVWGLLTSWVDREPGK